MLLDLSEKTIGCEIKIKLKPDIRVLISRISWEIYCKFCLENLNISKTSWKVELKAENLKKVELKAKSL